MFDIKQELIKYRQWHNAKINSIELATKSQPKQPEQLHISKIIDYDKQAENEAMAISRSYKGCNVLFDKRLKRGQKHRVGGF